MKVVYRKSDFEQKSVQRFLRVDPIAERFPHVTTYNYAENSPIANIDLWGLQAENFMTKFKNPGELKVKVPDPGKAQIQNYSSTVKDVKVNFENMKTKFSETPQEILTNSKAEFNEPVDGNGNPSAFKEGSFIKIDIDGPLNNSFVKVKDITNKEECFSATFQTMEGHIEKGEITFNLSKNNDGGYTFNITSQSQVDMGMAPEGFSRDQQKKSWIEVLNNFVIQSGGKETKRESSSQDPKN